MAADQKTPGGAPYPLVPTQDDRPRWWLLLVIVVVGVVLVAAVIGAANLGDERVPEVVDELWGMRWEVRSVEGDEAPGVPVDGSLTVDFDADRRVRFTGCNGGFGSVSVSDGRLRAGDMASTQMACLDPEGEVLMDWDGWFSRLLMDGVEVRRAGDGIVLRGDAGSVELRRVGPVEEPEPVEDPDASVSSDSASSDGG